jgi:hypothetical protein
LDEIARSRAIVPGLSLSAVPRVVDETHDAAHGGRLSLDRGALRLLLAIDGQRTVGDLLTMGKPVEVVEHLYTLVGEGLIELVEPAQATTSNAPPVSVEDRAANGRPVGVCPKLGFADDPTRSFSRPTRTHRCFALGRPLVVASEQQAALCLTPEHVECPRFTGQTSRPAARRRAVGLAAAVAAGAVPSPTFEDEAPSPAEAVSRHDPQPLSDPWRLWTSVSGQVREGWELVSGPFRVQAILVALATVVAVIGLVFAALTLDTGGQLDQSVPAAAPAIAAAHAQPSPAAAAPRPRATPTP